MSPGHRTPLTVPAQHPAFDGHFPGNPILPGVVLLDAALRCLEGLRPAAQPALPTRWRILNAKFVSPVRPGEPLTLEHDAQLNPVKLVIRSAERIVASAVAAPLCRTPAGEPPARDPITDPPVGTGHERQTR